MKKSISIIGSTGSIGAKACRIIEKYKERFEVIALAASKNSKLLAEQANILSPKYIIIEDKTAYEELKRLLPNYKGKILQGRDALLEISQIKVDRFLSSIVGFTGLLPTIEAIKAGSNIALANKETMVCAGALIRDLAKKYNVNIYPIDSEHNTIFQLLENRDLTYLDKIIITASGGPFLNYDKSQLENVTIKDALNHPRWQMGPKITIDSASLMNKVLEVIEAYYLFPVKKEQLDILIHPESIIHGIINFIDGTNISGMSYTDMYIPIAHALFYPERIETDYKISFPFLGKLTFFEPDSEKFRSLALGKQVLYAEKSAPVIMNAANEIAVQKFLQGEIKFTTIVEMIESALNYFDLVDIESIEQIVEIDRIVRNYCLENSHLKEFVA